MKKNKTARRFAAIALLLLGHGMAVGVVVDDGGHAHRGGHLSGQGHLGQVVQVVVTAAGVGVRRDQPVPDLPTARERPAAGDAHAASSSGGSASRWSTTSEVTARVRHT